MASGTSKPIMPMLPVYVEINGRPFQFRGGAGHQEWLLRMSMHMDGHGDGCGDGWLNGPWDYGDTDGDGCGGGWMETWNVKD